MLISLKNIKLIVYDFDGVMTNNKLFINQSGEEMVQVNRADGLGVSEIKKLGIEQMIISSEKNPVVSARAKKIDISFLQGVDKKEKILIEYCKKNNIDINTVAFVGNDVNDLNAMKIVGLTICPSDSAEQIKKISTIILQSAGGEGVVREIYDLIKN